jgi:hypothetical protein
MLESKSNVHINRVECHYIHKYFAQLENAIIEDYKVHIQFLNYSYDRVNTIIES